MIYSKNVLWYKSVYGLISWCEKMTLSYMTCNNTQKKDSLRILEYIIINRYYIIFKL